MNYSIHTVGLRKEFKTHIEFDKMLKRLYSMSKGRFPIFQSNNEWYAEMFKGRGIEPLNGRIPMRSQRFLLSICCLILQRGCPFPSEFACLEATFSLLIPLQIPPSLTEMYADKLSLSYRLNCAP